MRTNCCQTLLLCAASLNNLSRVETTSVYSIMANETMMKLRNTIEMRGPGVSIFLYVSTHSHPSLTWEQYNKFFSFFSPIYRNK